MVPFSVNGKWITGVSTVQSLQSWLLTFMLQHCLTPVPLSLDCSWYCITAQGQCPSPQQLAVSEGTAFLQTINLPKKKKKPKVTSLTKKAFHFKAYPTIQFSWQMQRWGFLNCAVSSKGWPTHIFRRTGKREANPWEVYNLEGTIRTQLWEKVTTCLQEESEHHTRSVPNIPSQCAGAEHGSEKVQLLCLYSPMGKSISEMAHN